MSALLWFIVGVVILGAIVFFVGRRPKPQSGIKHIEVEVTRPQLHVRQLRAEARERYLAAWQTVQSRLDDEPEASIREGDRLLQTVMRDCGYPTGDFGRAPVDVSIEEKIVLDNYLVAHRVSVKSETGSISPEEVQRAMIALQAAFDGLLAT